MNKSNLPRDWKTLNKSKVTLRKELLQVFSELILKLPSWITNTRKWKQWRRSTKWERIPAVNSIIVEAYLSWEMLWRKRKSAYLRRFQPKVLKKITNNFDIPLVNISLIWKHQTTLTIFKIIILKSNLTILNSYRILWVQNHKTSKSVEHQSSPLKSNTLTKTWQVLNRTNTLA